MKKTPPPSHKPTDIRLKMCVRVLGLYTRVDREYFIQKQKKKNKTNKKNW